VKKNFGQFWKGRTIVMESSQMDGFDANSFNMRFNEHTKKHQCFFNFATTVQAKQASELFNVRIHGCQLKSKPVKDKNEINPVKERLYHIISIHFEI